MLRAMHYFAALNRMGFSVRACLMALVAAMLVPVLIFGWWAVGQLSTLERARIEAEAEREAREVTATIDREIENVNSLLMTLARSYYLRVGDLKSFYEQAREISNRLSLHTSVRDIPSGAELFNTAVDWGYSEMRNPPPASLAAMRQALQSRQIVISDVFFARKADAHFVTVGIVVEQDDKATYYLTIGIPTKKFANIFRVMSFAPQLIVSIVDRSNTIVARSIRHDDFTGTKIHNAPDSYKMEEGATQRVSRDGTAYRWIRLRSDVSGWFTTIGLPLEFLDAPRQSTNVAYGSASLALFCVALFLTHRLGGRLAQSVGVLGIDRSPTREEFQSLFESAPNGVVVLDSKGAIVLTNERMLRKFEYSRDEMIGKRFEYLISERCLDRYRHWHHQSLQGRQIVLSSPDGQLYGRRKNGSEFPIEISLNPLDLTEGLFVIATVLDITVRTQATERLALAIQERNELRRRVMHAQEDERLRLAHELHDETGQILTGALFELKHLEKFVEDYGRERIRLLRKQLEQMGKALHRIAWELRPASIDELGLSNVLGTHVSEWSVQTGIDAQFHCRDAQLDMLPPELLTIIYRICQEALTNIAKHAADATSVSVLIDRVEDTVRLTIEDNGAGFAPNNQPHRTNGGLGLAGMRERLALIGGQFDIESSPGSGTTVFIRIPLSREKMIA
jgi:two-component system, NarL family, sensor histidine kinase UhpB